MALIGQPPDGAVQDTTGNVATGWTNFFSTSGRILAALTLSGSTLQRPTAFLWTGRPFFDVTLGIPIWLLSVNPNVWCDSSGAPV